MRGVCEIATLLGNDTGARRRDPDVARAVLHFRAPARCEAPFAGGMLPAFRFTADEPRGTIVAFGGFDSYIEESFPILLGLRDRGWTVVAFEGPGQGTVLEGLAIPAARDCSDDGTARTAARCMIGAWRGLVHGGVIGSSAGCRRASQKPLLRETPPARRPPCARYTTAHTSGQRSGQAAGRALAWVARSQ